MWLPLLAGAMQVVKWTSVDFLQLSSKTDILDIHYKCLAGALLMSNMFLSRNKM